MWRVDASGRAGDAVRGWSVNCDEGSLDVAEVAVCALSELPPGAVTAAEISGQRVCVANVHGEVFAVQDKCPHLFAPLSVGDLKGAHIVCPWHDSEFDMRTGRTKRWLPTGMWSVLHKLMPPPPGFIKAKIEPEEIRTFRTRVDGETVYVSDE